MSYNKFGWLLKQKCDILIFIQKFRINSLYCQFLSNHRLLPKVVLHFSWVTWKVRSTFSLFFKRQWFQNINYRFQIYLLYFLWLVPLQYSIFFEGKNTYWFRRLVGSTDQACSSGFYFRIAWKSTERPCFLQNHSLSILHGLRSLKNWLLQKLSMKTMDQKWVLWCPDISRI